MFIYLIVNHATGKYYVGQHKGTNLRKYLQDKFSQAHYELRRKRKGGSHLFNSMRKHPKDAWSIHALLSGIATKPELDQYERDFITFLKSQDPEYGYNICRGGEGFTGPHTEEAKMKTFTATKAWWTPERKAVQAKKSKAWWTPERKVANSERMKGTHYVLGKPSKLKGRKLSKEHRQLLSDTHLGQVPWNKDLKTFVFRSPLGEFVTTTNLTSFCLKNGLSKSKMSNVFNGKRNTHRGWTKQTLDRGSE